MAKKTSKRTSTSKKTNSFKKFAYIVCGYLLILFCISLILSMIGYTPTDESFNVSNSDKINNFMGRFGSYSSDFIVNSYGFAIFVFLVPLLVWGYLLIKNQKIIEFKIRLFAVILGIISFSGVLFQTVSELLEKINLLGKFSHTLPVFLMNLFKKWGITTYESQLSLVVLLVVSLMSFNLATGITFKQWYKLIRNIINTLITASVFTYRFVKKLINPKSLFEEKKESNNVRVSLDTNRKEPAFTSQVESKNKEQREDNQELRVCI